MKLEFVELAPFAAQRAHCFENDDDFARFQSHLGNHPELVTPMPGCGGLRKIRWPGRGKGKSGGLRIIYLNVPEQSRIYLIDVYAKGEQENISPEDKRDYRRLVLAIRKSPR